VWLPWLPAELLKTVGFIGFADKKCEYDKNNINIGPDV